MKRFSLFLFLAVLCGICTMTVTSCGDDDGIVDYDQNPYLKYKLKVGGDFMMFYDVTITYKSVDGKDTFTEKLNALEWEQRMNNTTGGDPTFYYIITAKAKDSYTISDAFPTYDLTYQYGVSWYAKSTGAKEYNQGGGSKVTRANMQEYINSHQTIEICNITMKPGMDE